MSNAPTPGRSLIAADLTIKGEVSGTGALEVQGTVDGKIDVQTLVIGQEGVSKGGHRAETVELRGRLDGKLSCRDLTVRSAAQMKADVNYISLHVDSGALIQGRFTRPKKA